MANRNWRSGGAYQSFNQLLNTMPYYHQMNYSNDRKNYGGRVSYREENYKRERKDFQGGRRDRISPNRRRSPYQRSHDSHGNFRRDSKKSHGRYEVKAPRLTFDIKELSTSSLKVRYPKMYIPSDFFHAHLRWQEVFPLYRTMKLGNHSEFQILHKDVEFDEIHCPTELSENMEPADANYSYSAKVMLMTTPNLIDLYKATCNIDAGGTNSGKVLNKNIQFLIGSKGKNEPMAIGGPWSPSLDGQNPDKDSTVLVNTAIRTCKSLVGIDLSKCKRWYKFLEINYYRPIEKQTQSENLDKETHFLENGKARVEKVVIFIPDIWSCVPTDSEWAEVKLKFEKKLASLTATEVSEEKQEESSADVHLVEETKIDEDTEDNQDLQQMKVVELKAELSSRGLDTKGVKVHLVKRLQEALDIERGKTNVEKQETNTKPCEMVKENKLEEVVIVPETAPLVAEEAKQVEENKELSEKEKKRIEKLYKLNEKPSILVQPNKKAKANRFECSLVTLEALLEYRIDDQKEHIFEMSLFAEQVNEMIQRDAAFYIFKSLSELPEQVSEPNEPALKKARLEINEEKVQQISGVVNHHNHPIRKSKVIVDIDLLFSFSVFDYDNCGYIKDHDLEDIIHSIGLNFSRSQVRKLISKIPNKRGSLMYKEVIDREVIEDSEQDVAVLKTRKLVSEKVAQLSMGNKTYFEECDIQEIVTRRGSLNLLDQLTDVELKKIDYQTQLVLIKDELAKIKTIQNVAGDVETNLNESIGKIKEKLDIEKETFNKLSQTIKVYNEILKSVSSNMGSSIKTINDQFDQERVLAEELKAKEEAESKAVMMTEESENSEEKKWQVVDQV